MSDRLRELRAVMKKNPQPTVDEADVEIVVALAKQSTAKMTAEERADAVSRIAADYATAKGSSPEWGEALARKVRSRALWTKPTTSN